MRKLFLKRKKDSHKNDYGKVLIIAGSYSPDDKSMLGATLLCSKAAIKTGVGICSFSFLMNLEGMNNAKKNIIGPLLLSEVPELIYEPIISKNLFKKINDFNAVCIGPGINVNASSKKILKKLLRNFRGRLLIDADGLNNLSKEKDSKKLKSEVLNRKYETVLTPHIGEAKKLFTENYEEEIKKAVTNNKKLIVVLKASMTKIFKKGEIKIHNKQNPALATAGSGDVLAGIITALLAEKSPTDFSAFEAAYFGVYIHGQAGKLAKEKFGERAVVASDIIDNIYKVFNTDKKNANSK
ncbi:MAG: NAD(P)H-hydrate dehydratase [Clostridiales Family XIII bacterium]|jgi:NAD(P)H-hydrate epimerase|nr:NAD(P)H-hydrate dehydratase [Clostridiales Family XIII bacterium]